MLCVVLAQIRIHIMIYRCTLSGPAKQSCLLSQAHSTCNQLCELCQHVASITSSVFKHRALHYNSNAPMLHHLKAL